MVFWASYNKKKLKIVLKIEINIFLQRLLYYWTDYVKEFIEFERCALFPLFCN